MATIIRGDADAQVQALKTALDAYETEYPGAEAALYRYMANCLQDDGLDEVEFHPDGGALMRTSDSMEGMFTTPPTVGASWRSSWIARPGVMIASVSASAMELKRCR